MRIMYGKRAATDDFSASTACARAPGKRSNCSHASKSSSSQSSASSFCAHGIVEVKNADPSMSCPKVNIFDFSNSRDASAIAVRDNVQQCAGYPQPSTRRQDRSSSNVLPLSNVIAPSQSSHVTFKVGNTVTLAQRLGNGISDFVNTNNCRTNAQNAVEVKNVGCSTQSPKADNFDFDSNSDAVTSLSPVKQRQSTVIRK